MRPLEWVLLVAFLPVLARPFVPPAARRRWRVPSAVLPVLASVLQSAVEGWRTQLIPLYALAGLVLLSGLPARPGQRVGDRRGRDVAVTLLTAVVVAAGGVLAGWALPVPTLPDPTGPHAVGVTDRELLDDARGRRLMASVWYPAEPGGPAAPLTHDPDEVGAGLSTVTGLPAPVFQHLRHVDVPAVQDAPVRAGGEPWPVLVFSHGMIGMRLQSASTFAELASWGYVVVALDHTDAAAVTVFPDGEARHHDLARFGVPGDVEVDQALMTEHVLPVWVADQRFAFDVVEDWAGRDPLLGGRVDPTRIGSFGHSFGGATAVEVCLVDERCVAATDLDGGLYGQSRTRPTTRPLLLMTSEDSAALAEPTAEWTGLVGRAEGAAYWLELPGSSHLSFTIMPLLSPLLAPQGVDPRSGLHTADTQVRAFFDTHLSGPAGPSAQPTFDEGAVRRLDRGLRPATG